MPTAILIVCGGLRDARRHAALEARCGVPVVSSMPAALRNAAQIAGAGAAASGRLRHAAQWRATGRATSIGEDRT